MCRFTAESRKLLSRRLKRARKGSGVRSLERSCGEYGLDSATAFRAINGISNPTAATIVALSDLFAVDAGKLLEGLEVER